MPNMLLCLVVAGLLACSASEASPGSCGAKGPDSTPWSGMIVNGQQASQCEWRWQAQLRSGTSGDGSPFCGGALISDRWVMTAAHCTDGQAAGSFTVKLGDYDRLDQDATSISRNVARIVQHPEYNSNTMRYDFSLLELDSPVPQNDCIGTVCLPDVGEELPADAECWITGWGTLNSGDSSLPQYLQEAVVKSKSNSECNSAYGGGITSDMLCANGVNSAGETTDACQGDSGGPLVCDAGSGRFVLHGATSWGYGCANPQYPGVWARISHELDWIHSYVDVPAPGPSPAPTPMPSSSTQLPTSTELPLPTSTQAPAPPGTTWTLVSGPCAQEGPCISSPNFPGRYSNDHTCQISVPDGMGPISVDAFSTEANYDKLTVNGEEYHGQRSPEGVTPTSDITWVSDYSVTKSGWKICAEPAEPSTSVMTTTTPSTTTPSGGGDACRCQCVCQCQTSSSSEAVAANGSAVDAGTTGLAASSPGLRGGSDSEAGATGEVTAFAGVGLVGVAVLGASSGIGFAVGRRARRASASVKDTE